MAMEDMVRLACYQALYNAIGPAVKSQGDGLRGDIDREMRERYEADGVKTSVVTRGGVRLGTYTIVESKAVPAHVETSVEVTDIDALMACEDDEFLEFFTNWANGHIAEIARDYFTATGELPDGVELRRVEVPAMPAAYKGGQMRVDRKFQQDMSAYVARSVGALAGGALPMLEGEAERLD